MRIEESRPLTMLIQDGRCAFAEIQSYEEDGATFKTNMQVKAGELQVGQSFTLILKPFDVFAYGICATQN